MFRLNAETGEAVLVGLDEVRTNEYVHRVYSDAQGYIGVAKQYWNIPSLDVYQFIMRVSKRTNDRLIEIGAHQASGRFDKTVYFFEYQGNVGSVPSSWYYEWVSDLDSAIGPMKVAYTSPADQVIDRLENVAGKSANWLFFAAIGAYVLLDSYGEVKGRFS